MLHSPAPCQCFGRACGYLEGMIAAPLPDTEYARLMALARYEVLDTLPEARFDRLAGLASQILQMPLAFLNFVDQFRHWGKACVGFISNESPRDVSFCAWTILQGGVLVVPDMQGDERFHDHPAVMGEPGFRFYAGAPLTTPDGHNVGTLCVLDFEPRVFGPREMHLLAELAALAAEALELRGRELELAREVEVQAAQVEELRRAAAHAETLAAITRLFGGTPEQGGLDPAAAIQASAELLSCAAEVDWTGLICRPSAEPGSLEPDGSDTASELTLVATWDRRSEMGSETGEPPITDLRPYRGGITGLTAWRGQGQFVDRYAEHPLALPELVRRGVTSLALLPLGEYGGLSYALVAARLNRTRAWRSSDRSLLDAAARSVRGALEQATQLQTAQSAAQTDSLTGLYNRRAFDVRLSELHAEGTSFHVVMVDLDGMKAVNDTQGHGRGDTLLTLFGQALRAQFRDTDRVYRLGGDEFAVLMEGSDLTLSEDDVLERIDLAVVTVRAASFSRVGASAGLAWCGTAGTGGTGTPQDAVQAADARMYEQKRRKVTARAAADQSRRGERKRDGELPETAAV